MKKKFLSVLCCLVLALSAFSVLTGCFDSPEDFDPENSVEIVNRWYTTHKASEPLAIGVQYKPATPTVRVPINPQRVILFGAGDMDMFLYLGLEDRVVGRASIAGTDEVEAAYPKISLAQKQAGEEGVVVVSGAPSSTAVPHDPDYDVVIALEPDLIIIEGRTRGGKNDSGHYQRLSKIAPTLDFGAVSGFTLEGTAQNLQDLVKIFPDVGELAVTASEEINNAMNTAVTLASQTNRPKTLMVLVGETGSYSLISHTARWTFVYNEIGLVPAIPDLGDEAHGSMATESILANYKDDIELLLVVDRNGNLPNGKDDVFNHMLFKDMGIKAITNDNYFVFPSDWYFSTGGVDGFISQLNNLSDALTTYKQHMA